MEDSVSTTHQSLQSLSEEIATLSVGDLSAEVISVIERCFVDTIGVSVAGANEDAGEKALATLRPRQCTGGIPVVGLPTTSSLYTAAFLNGITAHSLDYDDVSELTHGHPSATIIPVILALAEPEELSGGQAVAAYAAGFEVQRYLGLFIDSAHTETGWHATATLGTFGATAAAANAVGLTSDQTQTALNIAASLPAGLAKNFGTMTKPLHTGQAARSGLTAALLAAEGYSAANDAIWTDGGFMTAYSATDGSVPQRSEPYEPRLEAIAEGIHFKKYPCCYYTHGAIQASLDIIDTEAIHPELIENVTVTASEGAVSALSYDKPSTGLEGKFSMEYVVACALVHGTVDIGHFDEFGVTDTAIDRIRSCVEFTSDASLEYESKYTKVELTTDRDSFERVRDYPPGHATQHVSDAVVRRKFSRCLELGDGEYDSDRLFTELASLRDRSSLKPILHGLTT